LLKRASQHCHSLASSSKDITTIPWPVLLSSHCSLFSQQA
jgi:hypothetical protein